MMRVDEHSFDETLLNRGLVIDGGCRGFNFSKALRDLGCKVIALDIENFYDVPDGIEFIHAALWPTKEPLQAHFFGNGTANFIKGVNGIPYNGPDRPCETKDVPVITLNEIYARPDVDIDNIDILKLDVESAEYFILPEIKPLPKQITFEDHQHCNYNLHHERIAKIYYNLDQWYKQITTKVIDPRYPGLDTLFIRRDLL
jgi:hypothetical protein